MKVTAWCRIFVVTAQIHGMTGYKVTAWCRISVVTAQIHGMTGYKMTVGQQMVAVGYLCFVIQFRN